MRTQTRNGLVRNVRALRRAEEVLQHGVVRALYGCGENKAPLPSRWNTLSGVHPTARTADFVGGAVADGVIVIDIEGRSKQDYYRHLSEAEWAEMMERLRTVMERQPYVVYTASTPSGGLHIGIRITDALKIERSVGKVNALGLRFDFLPAGNNIVIAGDGRQIHLLRAVAEAKAFDPAEELLPLLMREIPQAELGDSESRELFRPEPFLEGGRNDSLYRYLRALKARGVFGDPLSDEVSDVDLELVETVLPYRCKPYYDEPFPSHALTQAHTLDYEEQLERFANRTVFDYNRRLLKGYTVFYNGERLRRREQAERQQAQYTPPAEVDTDFEGWMTILPATEVKRMAIPDDTDLFSFLRREHITLLHAPAKTGKSTFAYQLAESLAWGIPFAPLSERPKKQCRVLYIDLENDYRHIQNRLWLPSPNLHIARVNPQQLMFLTPDNLYHLLRHHLTGNDYDVVVFDNIFRVSGIDLNKAEDVSRLMMMFEGVAREFGCAMFLIHHSREDAMGTFKAFGSVVFQNIPAFLLELRRVPDTNQTKLKIRGRGDGDVQVLLDFRDGRYFPCRTEAVSAVEKQLLLAIDREGEMRIADLLSLYTRATLRTVFNKGLVRKVGDRVKLTKEGKDALLPDEQHPVWNLYADLRHLPELPVPYNDPLFVFWYYDQYYELPTAEDYEELCGQQSLTEEQAVAPEQEDLPDPATPATLCEFPTPSDDDGGDDDPDNTPPSGTFSRENPYIESETLMAEIEQAMDILHGDFHHTSSQPTEGTVEAGSVADGAEGSLSPSAHFFPATPEQARSAGDRREQAEPAPVEPAPSEPAPAEPSDGEGEGGQRSEAEQGGEDGVSLPATSEQARPARKRVVWHILDHKYKGVVYINGKPYPRTFRILEKRGDVMEVVEQGEGFQYDRNLHIIVPQSVLSPRFFEKFEPIAFEDLIIGTLDVETPTLQVKKGDDAEILVVGAGVRYPDGSFEDAYFSDIYSALMWLKRKGIHILVGHNLFGYDMSLRPSEWKRAGGLRRTAEFRQEQEKYEQLEYYAFPEFAVVDTYYLTHKAEQMGIAKFMERDLFSVARTLKVAVREEKPEWEEVRDDMEKVKERLRGDLLEAIAVFRAIWKNFHAILHYVPVGIQELFLRATGKIVSYILIHEAIKRGEPIPAPEPVGDYGGAYVSAEVGVYHNIVCTDVSSLYPNIMLSEEGCSRPIAKAKLDELTKLRKHYKRLAKQGDADAVARQSALKILINSFYGFYGTAGLPFNSEEIASNITAKGRELLLKMIERASARGKVVIADTDGIYVSLPAPPTPEDHRFFEQLLAEEGYELETAQYDACLVRAKKNYILYERTEDGKYEPIALKGSSLKGRDRTEAYKELIHLLVREIPSGEFSVDRTVQHIHRLLYEHHKHIVPRKISADARKKYPHLLTEADVNGDYFFYYYTVGTTKTGRYSYTQSPTFTRRVRSRQKGVEDMVVPPNISKHANSLLDAVELFVELIGKDAYEAIKQRVKSLIPPVDEWVRMWEQKAREA
jgi:hypothetical protein